MSANHQGTGWNMKEKKTTNEEISEIADGTLHPETEAEVSPDITPESPKEEVAQTDVESPKKSKQKRKPRAELTKEEWLEKKLKRMSISLGIHRFFTFLSFVLIAALAFYTFFPQIQYYRAVRLIDNGRLEEGIDILRTVSGEYYKADELLEKYKYSVFGTELVFGEYEQDGNTKNGAEPLEWIVLEGKDGMALITTKYSIDCKQYKDGYGATTWADSELRTWLNDRFLEKTFTEKELNKIVPTQLEAPQNPKYNTKGGESTLDKVFLLSADEFTKYLANTEHAIGYTTEYARSKGAISGPESGTSVCWLRTPGESLVYVSTVSYVGELNPSGVYTYSKSNGFRPVMWIMTDELK